MSPPAPLIETRRLSATLRGMGFMLLFTAATAALNTCIRYVAVDIHPFEVAFFRCLFGILVFAPVFLRQGFAPLRTRRPGLHVARGMLNVAAMLCGFLAVTMIPLAKFTALEFSAPLFGSLLAVVLLGEPLRRARMLALAVGFVGTWVILRPGLVAVETGALIALSAAAIFSVGMMTIKLLSRTESSLTITLYTTIVSLPFTLLAALPFWRMPTARELLWFAVIGALASLRLWAFAQAFKEAEVTAVLPLDFTKLLWAALAGLLVFGEVPDLWTWLGGVLIFAGATFIAYQERRSGAPRGPAPAPAKAD